MRLPFVFEILCCRLWIGAVTRVAENRMAESLYASDPQKLQKGGVEYMDRSVSSYDTGIERFTIN